MLHFGNSGFGGESRGLNRGLGRATLTEPGVIFIFCENVVCATSPRAFPRRVLCCTVSFYLSPGTPGDPLGDAATSWLFCSQ